MSEIINKAFSEMPKESENKVSKQLKDFDIKYLQDQIILCKDGINSGNWDGYSENLQARKLRLKEMIEELKNLKKCQ